MKYSEKLQHCVRCPTSYHANDHCVAAGTIQYSRTDILCPKHSSPVKSRKVRPHQFLSYIGLDKLRLRCLLLCSRAGTGRRTST